MVKAVVGANWGDEGKGKITDLRFTHYHPVCSMDIQQVLSVMV